MERGGAANPSWPQADNKLRSLSLTESMPRDYYASRNKFLRSYTFSREESFSDKTKKWLRGKQKMKKNKSNNANKPTEMPSTASSHSFLNVVFNCMFPYVAKVDVHEEDPGGFARKAPAQY